jgi:2,3-dimethylmalate lyase
MTGFGTAATYGLPDVGLLTLTEMADNVRKLVNSTEIPIIADADTGYGNYSNVMRTVQEYERAGAGALHLEDQVWPKRCGYMANKQVIPKNEAASKIKAAVDARRDPDFVIIARTDALAVNGWDDAENRLRSYVEAGADVVFVDGIRSAEDFKEYRRRLGDLQSCSITSPCFR